jgi:two-component system phosphate regulon sensor histidine kinase PhoR
MAMLVFSLSEVALTLKQANAELRNLDRLQMEFLGNLNHELRTPFQAIQTAVYLLQCGPDSHRLSGQQRETVALLGDTTDRLFALVTDLVDISAMSQGATTYDFAAHDVSELVDGTIRFLGNLIAERHITVTVDLPSDGLEAEVDDRRLRQVVVNLIANALKFTPPGGAVTVRLRREAEVLRLTVRDTGIGIPSSELERIFQRFYQVDGSSTRQVGGNGLGLAICKAIVEEGHNGRIWAESDGQGSTFTVVLPLEQAAAQTAAPLALSLTVA